MEEEKKFYVDAKDILEKKVNLEKIIKIIKEAKALLYIRNGKLFRSTRAGMELQLHLLNTMEKEKIEFTSDDIEELIEKEPSEQKFFIIDTNDVINQEINLKKILETVEGTRTRLFFINAGKFWDNSITRSIFNNLFNALRRKGILFDYNWGPEGPGEEAPL